MNTKCAGWAENTALVFLYGIFFMAVCVFVHAFSEFFVFISASVRINIYLGVGILFLALLAVRLIKKPSVKTEKFEGFMLNILPVISSVLIFLAILVIFLISMANSSSTGIILIIHFALIIGVPIIFAIIIWAGSANVVKHLLLINAYFVFIYMLFTLFMSVYLVMKFNHNISELQWVVIAVPLVLFFILCRLLFEKSVSKDFVAADKILRLIAVIALFLVAVIIVSRICVLPLIDFPENIAFRRVVASFLFMTVIPYNIYYLLTRICRASQMPEPPQELLPLQEQALPQHEEESL